MRMLLVMVLVMLGGCATAVSKAEGEADVEVSVAEVSVAEVSVSEQGLELLKGGDEADYGRAVSLFEEGCEEGDVVGCFHLGVMYWNGLGGEANLERAQWAYGRACEGGDAKSCNVVGVMYQEGIGVEVDAERAVAYFRRAIDGADGHGYFNLGVMYVRGTGVPLNPERGQELIEIACEQYGVCAQVDDIGEDLSRTRME